MSPSLQDLLGELHEERVRTWDPEDLEANIRQRRELVKRFDPSSVKGVGDRLDDFEFLDVEGGTVSLGALVEEGPAAIVLFRFAGCPACNIALPYYQRELWPALAERGIRLIAVSPQVPTRLGEIRERHGLTFTVASDPDNRFARYLGVTYAPNSTTQAYIARKGLILSDVLGTPNEDLPQATTLVIDQDRVVRFIDVAPDWLARTEAAPLIDAADSLKSDAAQAV